MPVIRSLNRRVVVKVLPGVHCRCPSCPGVEDASHILIVQVRLIWIVL